ncbi:MAG TPA: prenyltransferase, partial [bacterium]|nr:prenyltransferase [bacterium]
DSTARALNRGFVAGMYVVVAVLIILGRLTPFATVVALALPRGVRALWVMASPRPDAPPPGYVGWPLWYHRVCLVHNRLFGWVYVTGLALGALVT